MRRRGTKKQKQEEILDSAKKKAKSNLAEFLAQIGKIKSADDESAYENSPDDYRNDDSDGVPCLLASDIEKIQRQKLDKLNALNRELFPAYEPTPVEEDGDVDINARGSYGLTRMHQAVRARNAQEVKRLKLLGARWDIPDNWGRTAWDTAFDFGFDQILRIFDPKFVRKGTAPLLNFDDD